MKKVIAAILCTLILCGCGQNVGIIGGSDGPTTIFVGEEVSAQGVKMINVGGELFYDTGKNSSLIPRCGTLDGSLKVTGMEFEIPQKDGESNFETSGYQSATGITKEVPLDNNWRIFKKIDTNRDLSGYKYVLRLKGRHPNAASDSELIVLTNDLSFDFERASRSMFSSQSTDWLDCYIIPVLEEDKWGLMLWSEDVTPTGLTIVFEQLGGDVKGDLRTGAWYGLEKMNEENKWEKVEYLPHEHEIAWNSIAYEIKKNDRTEFKVDWEWLYGELPEGIYRIGKEVMDFKNTGDFDKDIYYAGFYIE